MKRSLLFLIISIVGFSNAFATHNRAGEITYTHISGFKYGITVTTYTRIGAPGLADKCDLTVFFGDGDSAIAPRTNGPDLLGCPSHHDGVGISVNTKKNIYYVEHIYPGPNDYKITINDPNRNAGICNIPDPPGSVNIPFTLITHLNINPFMPPNSSPILLNPPIDNACIGQCFEHNPGAYDVEGDSLYYTLSTCYADNLPIPGWHYPPNMNANSINHFTGTMEWCSPNTICQYNIAIVIEEWKLIPGTHTRVLVGSILRDMQIDVTNCTNPSAPQINPVPDTCVIAGTSLHFNVTATYADTNHLTLTSTGGPYLLTPAATFTSVSTPSPVTGTFNWTPDCSEIQLLPYLVTFKVTDNTPPTPMVRFESANIRVIAPAPTALTATPSGASMVLNWTAPLCHNLTGVNPLKGYRIYRKNVCDPWTPSPCETGVPAYTGYTLIGSTLGATTTFTDDNGGAGLTHGVSYSYIVVAYYADGSQSVASASVCQQLVRDVPIITNVSVVTTDPLIGKIWTHWVKPLGLITDLDTIANPPPYEYRLMRAKGFTGSLTFVPVSGASFSYAAYWQLTDTGFVSSALNTQDSAYTFRVDFYTNGLLKGSTNTASSVFLSTSASDNRVSLSWQEFVPWVNYRYDIYREVTTSGTFVFVDSTHALTFIDSGLVNGINYCYKVVTAGQYSDVALPRPLMNASEIKCATPVDKTPPCEPQFYVASDCGRMQNTIVWTNPNTYCSDDAVSYNVYFSSSQDGPMTLIYSTNDLSNVSFVHTDLTTYPGVPSVAGCYAVTALDSFANESVIIKKICVDNCPIYELPNVFTPNGDNQNDLFIPLPYRYVKDIDIKIYDRWGLEMFETTDPGIFWDGKNRDSKMMCPDGTYFYICTVNEIRLEGIVPRILKGFVQLIKEGSNRDN